MAFGAQHLVFRPLAPLAFLPSDFFDRLSPGAGFAQETLFHELRQPPARQKAVQALRALGFAAHDQAGGPMSQDDARGGLVGVLASRPAGADKLFLKIRFSNAKPIQTCGERLLFVWPDRNSRHAVLTAMPDLLAKQLLDGVGSALDRIAGRLNGIFGRIHRVTTQCSSRIRTFGQGSR